MSNISEMSLVFQIEDLYYAARTECISSLTKFEKPKPTPIFYPDYYEGIVNSSGEVSTAVDLNMYLNNHSKEEKRKTDPKLFIIVKTKHGKIALGIDKSIATVNIPKENLKPLSNKSLEKHGEFFEGALNYKDYIVNVIKLDLLLEKATSLK